MKICAITTYFNFTKSKSRYDNYITFAKNLPFFLVTVELANHFEDYQLSENHADVYIKATSKDMLWHKESLLNIALKHVPEEFEYIAWVDCDIVFTNKSLENEILARMEKFNLVQLFTSMYDMRANERHIPEKVTEVSGFGISYLTSKNEIYENSLRPRDTMDMRKTLFGLGWVSRKSILETHTFYDFCITGSGDRALYCAASGQYEVTKTNLFMNPRRFGHYMEWAESFNKAIDNKIGYIDGSIVHLFHGDITNRQYRQRHLEFSNFDFDPADDLMRSAEGTLEWKNNSTTYNEFFLNYLTNRKES